MPICIGINKNIKCSKRAYFNIPTEKPKFCGSCKSTEMVNVGHQECICIDKETNKKCNNRALYNIPNEPPRYCKSCKSNIMICSYAKKCLFIDKDTNIQCNTCPSYNIIGSKIPSFCFEHKHKKFPYQLLRVS